MNIFDECTNTSLSSSSVLTVDMLLKAKDVLRNALQLDDDSHIAHHIDMRPSCYDQLQAEIKVDIEQHGAMHNMHGLLVFKKDLPQGVDWIAYNREGVELERMPRRAK